jgi:hypothetical protein
VKCGILHSLAVACKYSIIIITIIIIIYLIANNKLLFSGWLALAPAFGGQLFITLFGAVFDWHQPSPTSITCEGSACYQDIFIFTSIACLASLVVSILLYRRRTQQAAIYLCIES